MRRLLLALPLLCACSSNDAASAPSETEDAAADVAETEAPKPPYEVTILDDARIGSKDSEPNFQNARGDVALKDGPFEKVVLRVELSSTCFPWEKWKDNPPPAGQNWPADCDAFDRNFETSLEDPSDEKAPGLELVRAITPFGGPLVVERDVTDVFNAITAPRKLRVHISTWSDGAGKVSGSNGGWNVTAKLSVTPGTPPRKVLGVVPLFYDSVGASDAKRDLALTTPEGTTSARIEYRVTGHGGADGSATDCVQPADEFCKRTHHVSFDGAEIAAPIPWRDDCKTLCTVTTRSDGLKYCAENPCGALASVRAQRANWCPGSETPPMIFEPEALKTPGAHTFGFGIDKVAEGASWRVSAVLFAYGD